MSSSLGSTEGANVTGGAARNSVGLVMGIVGEIKGHARVQAGWTNFDGVRYRIDVSEENNRRTIVSGTIEADPEVITALHDYGEATIDLGPGLGQFGFVVNRPQAGRDQDHRSRDAHGREQPKLAVIAHSPLGRAFLSSQPPGRAKCFAKYRVAAP